MAHREIPVQVTTPVDEGVADLVAALDAVQGVTTLDSSQEDPDGLACVTFRTHGDTALHDTIDHLVRIIDGQVWREQVRLSLRASGGEEPVAGLSCPPSLVPAVADQVRANAGHMTPSQGEAGAALRTPVPFASPGERGRRPS
jgi:hypothetical protein